MSHNSLIMEIVDRAQGVFLWVFLVVMSLRQGTANGDSLSILQRRLRSLPADLELYIKQILISVDPIYEDKVGIMFLAANEPLPVMTHSSLDKDPDFAVKLITHPMLSYEILAEQSVMRRRLNGRSKGLLEIQTAAQGETTSLQKVSFLHRTVRDFFQIQDINNMLKDMAPIMFDPNNALGHAHMAELKSGLRQDPHDSIGRIIKLARKPAKNSGLLDFALTEFWQDAAPHVSCSRNRLSGISYRI
jgi:hypothetical protein